MLRFDKILHPKRTHKEPTDELLSAIDKRQVVGPQLKPYQTKRYPLIHRQLNYYKPKSFRIKHSVFNFDNFKPKSIEQEKDIPLEEDILEPILGVPDKDIPDADNPSYYQFNLNGKTDLDISMDNLSGEPTKFKILKANAISGETIPTFNSAIRLQQDLPKIKAKFMKMISEKVIKGKTKILDPKIAEERANKMIEKTIATAPIKIQSKTIKLKPVVPTDTPATEVIPVSEGDDNLITTPMYSSIFNSKANQINRMIFDDEVSPNQVMDYLAKTNNMALIDKLNVQSLKILLKETSIPTKKLKSREQLVSAFKSVLDEAKRIDDLTAKPDSLKVPKPRGRRPKSGLA